jgi:hypothetical protein
MNPEQHDGNRAERAGLPPGIRSRLRVAMLLDERLQPRLGFGVLFQIHRG